MTVQYCVYFFLGVSVLSLIMACLFGRQVMGTVAFLKRQYKMAAALGMGLLLPAFAGAQEHAGGGEASLTLPDLKSVNFANFFGLNGHNLLSIGLLFCVGGLLFGLAIYVQLKNLPVHRSMREISELIYETCKTYLITQGKFILLLWVFIAVIISHVLRLAGAGGKCCRNPAHHPRVQPGRHRGQLRSGVVRNSREHIRELADCIRRIARQTVPGLCDSAEGGHEHRHVADLGRTAHHAVYPSLHSR